MNWDALNMNWDALGAIAQSIGSLAVVLTLVYLSIQVRQNTQQAKDNAADIRQTGLGQIFEMHSKHRYFVASSAENNRLLKTGLEDFGLLSDEERNRFDHFMWDVTWAYVLTWSRFDESVIPEDVWNASLNDFVENWIGSPGGKEWWETNPHAFPERFKSVVEHARAA